MANRKYIYFCEVEKFGYMCQVIALTKEEVKEAITTEYIKAFTANNGTSPKRVKTDYNNRTYYDVFMDELNIERRELGKVVWN